MYPSFSAWVPKDAGSGHGLFFIVWWKGPQFLVFSSYIYIYIYIYNFLFFFIFLVSENNSIFFNLDSLKLGYCPKLHILFPPRKIPYNFLSRDRCETVGAIHFLPVHGFLFLAWWIVYSKYSLRRERNLKSLRCRWIQIRNVTSKRRATVSLCV